MAALRVSGLFCVKVLWLHTDPLLVDVGQEDAVLLVQVVIQGVVPVLRLHQADNHKGNKTINKKRQIKATIKKTQKRTICSVTDKQFRGTKG